MNNNNKNICLRSVVVENGVETPKLYTTDDFFRFIVQGTKSGLFFNVEFNNFPEVGSALSDSSEMLRNAFSDHLLEGGAKIAEFRKKAPGSNELNEVCYFDHSDYARLPAAIFEATELKAEEARRSQPGYVISTVTFRYDYRDVKKVESRAYYSNGAYVCWLRRIATSFFPLWESAHGDNVKRDYALKSNQRLRATAQKNVSSGFYQFTNIISGSTVTDDKGYLTVKICNADDIYDIAMLVREILYAKDLNRVIVKCEDKEFRQVIKKELSDWDIAHKNTEKNPIILEDPAIKRLEEKRRQQQQQQGGSGAFGGGRSQAMVMGD